jgi:hypothetical protein
MQIPLEGNRSKFELLPPQRMEDFIQFIDVAAHIHRLVAR